MIEFDADKARAWLASPHDYEAGTVAEELGIVDDDGESRFGYEDGDFHTSVERLVGEASEAELFGAYYRVALWLTYDESCGYDGGVVTVDLLRDPGADDVLQNRKTIRFRLAGLHVDLKHLTDDRQAEGIEAAVAALEAIVAEAQAIVTGYKREVSGQ